ncbi:MAG: hypothetical protein JNL32_13790 [Candidatus Kapabacteria bacterium]|nr:hypothetical protein [Candidatus Kapabacteria bacterium]
MKSLCILFIVLLLPAFFSCSTKDDVQPPLPEDVFYIEYRTFNMAGETRLKLYRDSIRYTASDATRSPIRFTDTLRASTAPHLLSVLNSLPPLADFWRMTDVPGNPRIADEQVELITVSGYESGNAPLASRTVITKTLRYEGSEPTSLSPFIAKVDSLVKTLK